MDRGDKIIIIVGLALALLVGFWQQLVPDANPSLSVGDKYLPYHLDRTTMIPPFGFAYDGYAGQPIANVDYTGDGIPELVKIRNPGIMASVYENERFRDGGWQYNVPNRFVWGDRCAGLASGLDPDRDGREEVVMYLRTEDGTEHEIVAYDPLTDRVEGRVSLPSGPDRREDGVWDGYYLPCDVFSHSDSGSRIPAVLVSARVRYDGYGRGVYAVDLATGRILWYYATASSPMINNLEAVDLNGDGWEEVVFSTNSPGNLGKELVNGTTDLQSELIMLDGDGQLLWSRILGPAGTGVRFSVMDVQGDGTTEIVAFTSASARTRSEVTIWHPGAGELIARTVLPYGASHVEFIEDKDGSYLVTSSSNDGIQLYALSASGAELRKQVRTAGRTSLLMQDDRLMPESGTEIVVNVNGDGIWIVDRNLEPLAMWTGRDFATTGVMTAWILDEEHRYIGSRRDDVGCFRVTRSVLWDRLDPRPPFKAVGVMAIAAVGVLVRRRRRNGFDRHFDFDDPIVLRELRLHLLGDLELSGHGAVGVLRSLRRLLWNLENLCAGLGTTPKMVKRLNGRWRDVHEAALPHVRDILSLAERANISCKIASTTNEAIDDLDRRLAGLAGGGFPPEAILNELLALQDLADGIESGLQKIRHAVEDHFCADLREVADLVMRAHADALEEVGVEVVQTIDEGLGPCRIDAKQLEFMLDNLVDNALRAMAETARPRLTLSGVEADGLIVCEVGDNGWGIDPEDWQRFLETPYSSRKGGGLGLFETRRLLRTYGGSISVKRSRPGEGTTFVIIVPRVRMAG